MTRLRTEGKGTWPSDEADASIHWCQPHVISLCGKGWIKDKDLFVDLVKKEAKLQIKYCLGMFDNATGGTRAAYANCKDVDHWARNCLDSLCDKKIITTPPAWVNFEGNVTYGLLMALVCQTFGI